MRDKVIALKNESDGMVAVGVPVRLGELFSRFASDGESPAVVAVESAENIQKSRLSELVLPEADGHAVESAYPLVSEPVFLYYSFKLYHIGSPQTFTTT